MTRLYECLIEDETGHIIKRVMIWEEIVDIAADMLDLPHDQYRRIFARFMLGPRRDDAFIILERSIEWREL